MTNREFLTAIIANPNVAEDIKTYAQGELDKMNARNAKRKTAEGTIKEENRDLANAILAALANGPMKSTDLATVAGVSTQKLNGTALRMVELGMLTKRKVKVKGGEATEYALATAEVAPTEEATEDTATDEVAE